VFRLTFPDLSVPHLENHAIRQILNWLKRSFIPENHQTFAVGVFAYILLPSIRPRREVSRSQLDGMRRPPAPPCKLRGKPEQKFA
jgi:hypothetical protein